MKDIIVGSRGSRLALAQSKIFVDMLKSKFPEKSIVIKEITTSGDRIKDKSLKDIGGKGLFVKEIELALLNEEIDIAVHSLKDVPGEINSNFILPCFPAREVPNDVLISKGGLKLEELPEGAVLGTGSLRRRLELKKYRPDFNFVGLRGNVETRLKKMEENDLDGIILAAAGLHRLAKEDLITEYIPTDRCIPAVGQGTLGIEILKERDDMLNLLKKVDNLTVKIASVIERAFLAQMNGDCHLPVGAYADIIEKEEFYSIDVNAFLASENGERYIADNLTEKIKFSSIDNKNFLFKIALIGERLAKRILSAGGNKILEEMGIN